MVPPPATDAPIHLTETDRRLLDAPPVLALVRLARRVPSAAVQRALRARAPRRLGARIAGPDADAVLLPGGGALVFAAIDAAPGELDALTGVGVRVADLAAIGLGDAPARDPLCTLTHVRDPGGDALAVRLSHAAGDGISLLGMLRALLNELAGAPDDDAGHRPTPAEARADVLGRRELDEVAVARPDLSPTLRRMAVLARRVAPLVRPAEDGLRLRIPVDLRFRGLGIPADAVGNHWFDALLVQDGPLSRLPGPAELAGKIDAVVRRTAAGFGPEDVDHRPDESLRLRRDVPIEPLRRGVDLVHSALPAPGWPGLRELHLAGSATLGIVDVRGEDRVTLVSPRPLPEGVRAL